MASSIRTPPMMYRRLGRRRFPKSFRQEYNVTVSGATDKTDYFISAGYLSDPSYFVSSKFNRYNLRSNVNTQINKWLKAGVNIAYSRRAQQSMATRWGRNPGYDRTERLLLALCPECLGPDVAA